LHVIFINQCNARFLTIRFLQITLRAVINCIVKLNTCFETEPDVWSEVNKDGKKLLSPLDFKHYHNEIPDEENLQDE
jgi:hypothetical protein